MGDRKGMGLGISLPRAWARTPFTESSHRFALAPQMRHSVAAFGALLGTAAMLQQALGDIENWWNNWAVGISVVGEVLFTTGLPLTAAFACWLGGADARQDTEWLGATAARRPLPRVIAAVAPAVLWPVGGYLIVVAVAALVLSKTVYRSSVPLDALTSDIAAQTTVACLGYALGRATTLRLAAPIVWLLTRGYAEFRRSELFISSEYPQSYSGPGVHGLDELYFDTPPMWLPWLVTFLLCAVAATTLLLSNRHRALAALWVLAAVPLLTMAAAARLPSSFFAQEARGSLYYRAAPDPVPLECGRSRPRICVAADTSAPVALDPRPVKQLAERLSGVRGAPTHYVLAYAGDIRSARGHGWWTVAASAEDFDDTTLANIAGNIAQTPQTPCAKRHWPLVADWLSPSRLRDKEQAAQAARLDVLPQAQRTDWLGDYFSDEACARLPRPSPQPKPAS